MKLTHTSPSEITKIDPCGMFDDCLFFSVDTYSMSAGEVLTYTIEIDDIVSEVVELVGCDEDEAEEILSDRASVFDFNVEDAGEVSWKIQALQGRAAKVLGFEAAQAEDEQGVVYIVPMLGREADLVLA